MVVLILVESRETIAVTTMMMTTLFSFVVAVEYAPAVERESTIATDCVVVGMVVKILVDYVFICLSILLVPPTDDQFQNYGHKNIYVG